MIYARIENGLFWVTSVYETSVSIKDIKRLDLERLQKTPENYDLKKKISGLKIIFGENAAGHSVIANSVYPDYSLKDIKLDPTLGLPIIDLREEKQKRQDAWNSAKIGEPALA